MESINCETLESLTCEIKAVKTHSDGRWESKPFKLSKINFIPFDVPDPDATYILTCWDTNAYIKINVDNTFEIEELHGAELEVDKEYILIKTRF